MTQQPQKPQAPKQPSLTAFERIGNVEKIVSQFQQTVVLADQLRQAFAIVVETFDALIEELGGKDLQDKVGARITARRDEVRKLKNERSKSILEQLIKSGQMESVELAGPDTILTATESTADGAVTDEYVQTNFSNLSPELQAQLKDKPVGTKGEQGGSALTVTGIYKMKPAPQKPPLSETSSDGISPPPQALSQLPPAPAEAAAPEAPAAPTEAPAPEATPAAPAPAETPPEAPAAAPEVTPAPAPEAAPTPTDPTTQAQ